MASFDLLSLTNACKWSEYLKRFSLDQRDIYFMPEYYSIYETIGEGLAQCFVYEEDNNVVLYPFLKNSVNKLSYSLDNQYYDIQGVYGYNGILTNNNSQPFLNSFFDCFDNYCKQNNIIAEFSRINPLLQNPLLNRINYDLIHDRDNINVNLLNENVFDTEYEYSTRKNVRKAIKSGLTFNAVLGDEISDLMLVSFSQIYTHTMKRNNVDEYYYFDKNYFTDISTRLGKKSLFVFVLLDKQIISCELVLLGSKIAYSFLGGTLSDYYQYRPNDFLKHETISLLKEKGFDNFLLGGGSEGVFKYKKSFSKDGVIPFYIGKKIHNIPIYNMVVKQWESKYPEKIEKHKNILLKYRF